MKNVNLIFKELICDYIANPAIAAICVQITSNAEEIGCIVVVDVTGKMMMGSTGNLRKGLNTINIELDALQSGLYFFTLKTENGIQVEKFVKQ